MGVLVVTYRLCILQATLLEQLVHVALLMQRVAPLIASCVA
jgi:hypothetical protein